jgi:uncharacterized protein (DUF2141 family)
MRFSLFFLLLPLFTFGQNVPLTIEVQGLQNSKGKVMIKVVNDQGKEVLKYSQEIKDIPAKIVLNLAPNRYAIACFHDENNNGEIDKAFTGIPTELYGFSNDVRGIFGPPDLQDQLFTLQKAMTISLRVQ